MYRKEGIRRNPFEIILEPGFRELVDFSPASQEPGNEL